MLFLNKPRGLETLEEYLCALLVQGYPTSSLLTSVVFCRATVFECVKIQSIMYQYEQASGQSINRGKTNIFFSSNTLSRTKEAISNFLDVPVTQRYEHYLGLPSLVGRAKKKSFSIIKERIWKKLKG